MNIPVSHHYTIIPKLYLMIVYQRVTTTFQWLTQPQWSLNWRPGRGNSLHAARLQGTWPGSSGDFDEKR